MLDPVLLTPDVIVTFLTLTALEIVLAGDNLLLIAILAGKLPERQRPFARRLGLIAAVFTRIALLFSLFWLAHLQKPLHVEVPGIAPFDVTPRQIVLGIGGLFLIWKSFREIAAIFSERDAKREADSVRAWANSFLGVILQIAFFDIIFSLDSVIAAIGLAQQVEVMIAAVVAAAFVMFFLVNPISNFIDRYPIVRLIALNFLTLVGALLVAEAFELEVPRTYFYGALAVAVALQLLFLGFRAMSPGARTATGLLGVMASLALVVGAAFYMENDDQARARALAAIDGIWDRGQELVASAVEWVKAKGS